jgi:hypothetical protein
MTVTALEIASRSPVAAEAVARRHLLGQDVPAVVARAGALWDLVHGGLGGA